MCRSDKALLIIGITIALSGMVQIACTRADRRTIVHAIEDIVNVVCSDSDPVPLCMKKMEAYQAALDRGASKEDAKKEALSVKP
jgi:hypothetical protein